ncbi:unnamed protein product, partial [Protopolystoma xenopodis]
MTDEISERGVRRGPILANLQQQLQGNPPTDSGEANLRTSFNRFFKRNE